MNVPIRARIDALLPQTQCGACGYPDCAAYAHALAGGTASPDRCPPGGDETVVELARIAGASQRFVDPALPAAARVTAVIDEPRCIGCTLCMRACPVDAIVGARGRMHSVLDSECTGCALCVAPCPVDCVIIAGTPLPGVIEWRATRARRALGRYRARSLRLARAGGRARRRATPARGELRANVHAAIERVRARRAALDERAGDRD